MAKDSTRVLICFGAQADREKLSKLLLDEFKRAGVKVSAGIDENSEYSIVGANDTSELKKYSGRDAVVLDMVGDL